MNDSWVTTSAQFFSNKEILADRKSFWFPLVISINQTKMEQEPVVLNFGSNRDFLVLLFGWSGARDKNLKKYSEIYEKLGKSLFEWINQILLFEYHRIYVTQPYDPQPSIEDSGGPFMDRWRE